MADNKANMRVVTNSEERELVVERIFDAPRALVFKAWTEPEHLARWWGPQGWTLPVCKVDLRPGGVWHYCMRGPGGEESWGKAVYREIVPPERLVYIDAFADAQGNPVAGMPEMLIRMEFAEHEGKTKVTSRTQFATVAELESILAMGVVEGITETWDRLEEHLKAIQKVERDD
jgi:uncharacterized protein YndB with AHSA1/START domain